MLKMKISESPPAKNRYTCKFKFTKIFLNKIKEWENNHPNWDKTDDGI